MPCIVRSLTRWTPAELAELFKNAQTVYRKSGLSCRRAPTSGPFGRLLVIIPGRAGNAPQRNLLRRRLKALFYEQKIHKQGYDVIVYAVKITPSLTFDRLSAIITQCVS
jgi:Ribonuclease P.